MVMNIDEMTAAVVETDIVIEAFQQYNEQHPDNTFKEPTFVNEFENVCAKMKEDPEYANSLIQQMQAVKTAESIGIPVGTTSKALAHSRIVEVQTPSDLRKPPSTQTPPAPNLETPAHNVSSRIQQIRLKMPTR